MGSLLEIIQHKLLELVDKRGTEKTICPSEVVRALEHDLPNGWRAEMDTVRNVAFALAKKGRVHITQRGNVVPIVDFPPKGPIRVRKA